MRRIGEFSLQSPHFSFYLLSRFLVKKLQKSLLFIPNDFYVCDIQNKDGLAVLL